MAVLGIETSCDETAVALVSTKREILSQRIWTQQAEHATYGGVVPEIAARAHLQKLPNLLGDVLREGKITLKKLDAIAVTTGPGLIGGLIVGITLAKMLAAMHKIPLIGVNHLAGHLLSPRLQEPCDFPYLCLLVSGGHSQIVLVHGINNVEILGQTLDDAAGEAFDKGAKILGLGFPGGPALAKTAEGGVDKRFHFTSPLASRRDCLDLSFSGIKTALARQVETLKNISAQDKADLAANYEKTIVNFLLKRLSQSLERCHEKQIFPTSLVIAGGVGANHRLQKGLTLLSNDTNTPIVSLNKMLCTDNAAMIAWAGIEGLQEGVYSPLTMRPQPRWPLTEGFFSQ